MKIGLPNEQNDASVNRIDVNVPLTGAQGIAQVAKETGKQLEAVGKKYLEMAYDSIQDTFANNAISKATLELTEGYLDRTSPENARDKNGNPTFGSLERDIDKMGSDIGSKYGMYLADPKTKAKFNQAYTNLFINKKIQANQTARSQQLDYAKGSLIESLSTLERAAERDNGNNSNVHLANMNAAISGGLSSGALSFAEAARLKGTVEKRIRSIQEKARLDSYQDSYEKDPFGTEATRILNSTADELNLNHAAKKQMDAEIRSNRNRLEVEQNKSIVEDFKTNAYLNPNFASEFKAKSPEEVGVSAAKKYDMDKLADAVLQDQESKVIKEQREQELKHKQYQNANKVRLESGILEKSTSTADIQSEFITGGISEEQRNHLFKTFKSENKEQITKLETNNSIAEDVKKGLAIAGKYSDKQLNSFYEDAVEANTKKNPDGTLEKPAFEARALLVSSIKAPVKLFNQELNVIAQTGETKTVDSAVNAYKILQKVNPLAISQMDNKSKAIMDSIAFDTTEGNMPLEVAIQRARNAVNVDPEINKLRSREFEQIKSYQLDKATTTIKKALGINGFTRNANIDSGTVNAFRRMIKDEYELTGDLAKAESNVIKRTAPLYGKSEFNETKGWVDDTENFMLFPPEKMFSNLSVDTLKKNLSEEVTPHLPKGYTSDDVRLVTDDYSKLNLGRFGYAAERIDDQGNRHPIYKSDGKPFRWLPNEKELIDKELTEQDFMSKSEELTRKRLEQQKTTNKYKPETFSNLLD